MSFDPWSERVLSLNAFRTALLQGTHGLVLDLALDHLDGDRVVIRGVARSHYGVQLAIHATKQYVGSRRTLPQAQLLLSIDGRRLNFVIAQATIGDADETLSTRGDIRRPQLTTAASA